ncbi:MAG: hypothetical protein QOI85_1552 [Chloroflexota bacterium]|jgi:hypothetical protein|nr:hypothetical protein [Chloroflexota bacterium]
MTIRAGIDERIYRGILLLYPAEFRDRFADEMVQLFHDKLRDARAGSGSGGAAGAWLRMLGDVATTAALERMRRNRIMAHSLTVAPPRPVRALGIAGIIGGAVLLAAFVIPIPDGLAVLRIFMFNLGAIAVVLAVHARQAPIAPALALSGAVPAVLANAWYLVMVVLMIGRPDPAFGGAFGLVAFWAALAMWIGDAWFGLVTFRLGAVTRVGAMAVALGATLAITGIDRLGLTSEAAPTIFGPLSQIGIITMGIGWILLGLDIAFRRRAATRTVTSGS